jgi:starch-binding outer membrane protein, SusD/RagB family
MKLPNIIYLALGISAMVSVSSCRKYLDRVPLDTITSEFFYTNGTQVQQALTGVYNAYGARTISPGYSNPTTYYAKMDLHTEIGLERGLNGTIGSGAYNANEGSIREIWGGFFQTIQRANSLLFNMPKAQAVMDAQEYAAVAAEARVLRASAYWYLMVYFGDVPFFTGPLEQSDFFSAVRKPKAEIITFLVNDLKEASASLNWLPSNFGRVSKGVALGVAARLAMLDRRYAEVISLTDNIINNGPYNLNPSFQNLFRKAGQAANVNNEIMFIYPYGDADGGSFNYLNLVQGSRNQGGQSSHFPSQFLVDLFESIDGQTINNSPLYNPAQPGRNRDPRMKQTVIVPGDTVIVQGFTSNVFSATNRTVHSYNVTTGAITLTTTANQDSASIFGPRLNGGGNLWRKYVQDRDVNGTAGNLYKVGWVYMRFAEILLLNAEAKMENGAPATEVAVPVNRVRTRAGMPVISAAILGNATALKQLVRREKTVEFANEGIHIADMRRWDNGAYAAKVMPLQIYGGPLSAMTFVAGQGLVFNNPAPPPVFDPEYNVPISWPNGDALRLKRELRIFNLNQHILSPIPQPELDKVKTLTQNPNW